MSISLVICLSDDDDNNTDNDNSLTQISIVTPIKQQESSTIVNNNTSHPSNWIIDEKDIIHVSQLPSKYTDIYKKAFEIRCTAIHFGIVEFNVESEIVLMQSNEFEMKLTGKDQSYIK